jgi:hypothetical protein
MTTFHFHFPTPPPTTHFDPAPVDDEHPGAVALRDYWQAHQHDAPAVKKPPDVVANVRRATVRHNRAQDEYYNGLVLLAWQMVQRDGLTIEAACTEVKIAQGTYRKRVRRLELDATPVE